MRNRISCFCRTAALLLVLLALPLATAAAGEKMDLSKAIRIGTGPTMVIEFTDPDCPFCRKAAAYFRERRDVTLYVFLKPLARHPQAKEKARYILSAPDRAKAYHDVMAGKLDDTSSFPSTAAGSRLLDEHLAIAAREKIDAAPIFLISGRIVRGFNKERIEELLPR